MADEKVSALTVASTLDGTELVYVVQGTVSKKTTIADIYTLFLQSLSEENYTVTGTTQTILQTPVFIYGVFLNGQRLTVTTDYIVAGTTITFINALASDSVTVVYSY
jgi:hypothetical protein